MIATKSRKTAKRRLNVPLLPETLDKAIILQGAFQVKYGRKISKEDLIGLVADANISTYVV